MTAMAGVATFTLVVGMADDLRSGKIHNNLVVGLFAIGLGLSFYFRGVEGSVVGFGTLFMALAAALPLFMWGIWGGGDAKLFMVFAFAVDPSNMFWTLVYSFVWGAVFGLTRAALQNQLMTLVKNTYRLAMRRHQAAPQLHKIPYSFALLLGWFTQLTWLRAGGYL